MTQKISETTGKALGVSHGRHVQVGQEPVASLHMDTQPWRNELVAVELERRTRLLDGRQNAESEMSCTCT
jgi:hypothetical protein